MITEVVAALIWNGSRFMICQRPAEKARGLLWEFVGGKVEPGETKEQALVRECREELAITVAVEEVFMEVTHEYPDLTIHLTLFRASIAEGVPQLLEHHDIRWITVGEIDAYPFCPADEVILARLRAPVREGKRQHCLAMAKEAPNERSLLDAYPQIEQDWLAGRLRELDLQDILLYYCETAPETGLAMWRSVLDAPHTNLRNPRTAYTLLGRVCHNTWSKDPLPLLDLLERDEHFARQLFQSAFVGTLQESVLRACAERLRMELLRHLLDLLKENPLHKDRWSVPWERFKTLERQCEGLSASAVQGRGEALLFRFCTVRFAHLDRSYAYLTEDPSIVPGDAVLVPLGWQNTETPGIVEEVRLCTAAQAPYPPGSTKHILQKIPKKNG